MWPITSLRGEEGPGIELLEDLAPRDGQPFPADERANDVLHRQTILLARNAEEASKRVLAQKSAFVSSGLIANPTGQLGFEKAFLVRDPDGHVLEIEQP